MENYICINGKKIDIYKNTTDKEILGFIKENMPKSSYDRNPDSKEKFYYISDIGSQNTGREDNSIYAYRLFANCNYFSDLHEAKYINLQQSLYRQLRKFAVENGYLYDFSNKCCFRIVARRYKNNSIEWNPCLVDINQFSIATVYFNSYDNTMKAIDEVVEPFIKKHPWYMDFVVKPNFK